VNEHEREGSSGGGPGTSAAVPMDTDPADELGTDKDRDAAERSVDEREFSRRAHALASQQLQHTATATSKL